MAISDLKLAAFLADAADPVPMIADAKYAITGGFMQDADQQAIIHDAKFAVEAKSKTKLTAFIPDAADQVPMIADAIYAVAKSFTKLI